MFAHRAATSSCSSNDGSPFVRVSLLSDGRSIRWGTEEPALDPPACGIGYQADPMERRSGRSEDEPSSDRRSSGPRWALPSHCMWAEEVGGAEGVSRSHGSR